MILRGVSKKNGAISNHSLSWRLCCLLFGKGEEVSNFVKKQATSGQRFWGSGRLAWRMGFCPFFDAGNLGGSKRNRFLKRSIWHQERIDRLDPSHQLYNIPHECPQDESRMYMKSKVWNIFRLGCLEDCDNTEYLDNGPRKKWYEDFKTGWF